MRGGHGNIVTILGHDWLRHSFNQCYYIDMELCDFSLYDYINYHKNSSTEGLTEITVGQPLSPTLVQKNCGTLERLQNLWTIGLHIARGLEFMHANKHAHRDFKPGNGKYAAKQMN
jgi:serine/threonine protein kinase